MRAVLLQHAITETFFENCSCKIAETFHVLLVGPAASVDREIDHRLLHRSVFPPLVIREIYIRSISSVIVGWIDRAEPLRGYQPPSYRSVYFSAIRANP